MTLLLKLPQPLQRYLSLIKGASNAFLDKLRVVTDNNIIISSVRILCVVLALLMAYVQSTENGNKVSSLSSSKMLDGKTRSIIDQLK